VPFGGVAGGCEGEHVGFVVDDDRMQVGVDTLQQRTVACGGLAAQFVQECLGCRGNGGCGEPDRHVVQNAWLAGGVDLARSKFGHIDAGFDSSASAHTGQVTGFQKFGDRIQHIKIDHSDQVDALLAGQPGQGGRGIAVGVERKEGMAVHIGHALRRWRNRVLFHQALQRFLPATEVEMVEGRFQLQIYCTLHHDRSSLWLGRRVSSQFFPV
jgi:hypothetical protein